MKKTYYYFIQLDSEEECTNKVEQNIRIMENVIRYLCVKKEA